MEIYKIAEDGKENRNSVITNLKPGVKNPNRVNVFVDGEFSFSLDVSQVVDFKIKVGREISEEEISEFKKASEYGKLYQRTLEWVLVRPRSIREVKDYLLRRKIKKSSSDALLRARRYGAQSLRPLPVGRGDSSEDFSDFSDTIIKQLTSKGYLDDVKFAEWYVENRFVKKGVSKKRLKMELMKKGISQETIKEVLEKRNDEEEILKMVAKKRGKYTDEKLVAYLVRQGFSYNEVKKAVEDSGEGSGENAED